MAVGAARELHRKNYIGAMRLGFDAVSLCREAGTMDRENADVDFVLGFYGYARAEMRKKSLGVLFWYPKDNGIRLLERCAEKGRIASLAATMALPDIYIREGLYDKASAAIDRLGAHYPRGRFHLWAKARLCEAQKNYSREALTYLDLADAYAAIPQARRNCLQTLLYAASGFRLAGEKDKARDACLRAIALCGARDGDFRKTAKKLLRNI
jgi:tetratricopeptide (TPR) repeat protein